MLRLHFTTYSPVHISSGRALAYNLDYVRLGNQCGIFDINQLSSFLARKKAFDFSSNITLDALRNKIASYQSEYKDEVFTSRIKLTENFIAHLGNERAPGKKDFLEFVNSNGNYYIPGSSVKGALLTILHRDFLGIENYIQEKFVIQDSAQLNPSAISVYRTEDRPPIVSLMCIDPDTSFFVDIKKSGQMKTEDLKKKLSNYTPGQIKKALPVISKFKSKNERQSKGADYYLEILEDLSDIRLDVNEYLINLGFGGGSWFKLFNDVAPPKFNNPGKRGKLEEAHTTFFIRKDNKLLQLGWCKLRIEELK